MSLHPTPSQTVGPYFSIGLPYAAGSAAVPSESVGAITIAGMVFDGAGAPVADHVLETWQDDGAFRAFTRAGRELGDGRFAIVTRKPRAADGHAPHINVSLFGRGMLNRVVTRIYFPDEDNSADPVLGAVPAQRRATLLARAMPGGYHFDIRLQGERETVFFDV